MSGSRVKNFLVNVVPLSSSALTSSSPSQSMASLLRQGLPADNYAAVIGGEQHRVTTTLRSFDQADKDARLIILCSSVDERIVHYPDGMEVVEAADGLRVRWRAEPCDWSKVVTPVSDAATDEEAEGQTLGALYHDAQQKSITALQELERRSIQLLSESHPRATIILFQGEVLQYGTAQLEEIAGDSAASYGVTAFRLIMSGSANSAVGISRLNIYQSLFVHPGVSAQLAEQQVFEDGWNVLAGQSEIKTWPIAVCGSKANGADLYDGHHLRGLVQGPVADNGAQRVLDFRKSESKGDLEGAKAIIYCSKPLDDGGAQDSDIETQMREELARLQQYGKPVIWLVCEKGREFTIARRGQFSPQEGTDPVQVFAVTLPAVLQPARLVKLSRTIFTEVTVRQALREDRKTTHRFAAYAMRQLGFGDGAQAANSPASFVGRSRDEQQLAAEQKQAQAEQLAHEQELLAGGLDVTVNVRPQEPNGLIAQRAAQLAQQLTPAVDASVTVTVEGCAVTVDGVSCGMPAATDAVELFFIADQRSVMRETLFDRGALEADTADYPRDFINGKYDCATYMVQTLLRIHSDERDPHDRRPPQAKKPFIVVFFDPDEQVDEPAVTPVESDIAELAQVTMLKISLPADLTAAQRQTIFEQLFATEEMQTRLKAKLLELAAVEKPRSRSFTLGGDGPTDSERRRRRRRATAGVHSAVQGLLDGESSDGDASDEDSPEGRGPRRRASSVSELIGRFSKVGGGAYTASPGSVVDTGADGKLKIAVVSPYDRLQGNATKLATCLGDKIQCGGTRSPAIAHGDGEVEVSTIAPQLGQSISDMMRGSHIVLLTVSSADAVSSPVEEEQDDPREEAWKANAREERAHLQSCMESCEAQNKPFMVLIYDPKRKPAYDHDDGRVEEVDEVHVHKFENGWLDDHPGSEELEGLHEKAIYCVMLPDSLLLSQANELLEHLKEDPAMQVALDGMVAPSAATRLV